MTLKLIYIPRGTPDTPIEAQSDFYERQSKALNEWNRRIRAGYVPVGQYTSFHEGCPYAVFILHRRNVKGGHSTPRIRTAQAVTSLDIALAQRASARIRYLEALQDAKDNGTDEALAAERRAEEVYDRAKIRVQACALVLMKRTRELLDQGV